MKIMKVRQPNGIIVDIPLGKGADGKSAYAYAQESGYTGTAAEFSTLLANTIDKRKITLGLYTDGLIYLFIDGLPVGNGIALPSGGVSGDIVGNVDSANNIVLMGNLADGTYTVKYEMEDGSIINIGTMVLDNNVYYAITKNLTNCSISNSATSVIKGESYSATISANDGYELKSVSVTMGDVDISHTFEDKNVINIAYVTGNIVITAVAEEKQATEPVTETITLLKETSLKGTNFDEDRTGTAGHCATPSIDLTNIPKPCVINLTGARWAYADNTSTGYVRFSIFDTSGTKLVSGYTWPSEMPIGVTMTVNNGDESDVTVTVTSDDIGKLRFAGYWAWGNIEENLDGTVMVAKATLTYTPNGVATAYAVTTNLMNCTINNSAKSVVEGDSYSATISANSGYELKSVTVTMGGSAVSVSGGVINIASVTGDIIITAIAEEKVVGVEPTNFFDASQGFAGRLSSSGADRTDSPASFVTNYVPVQVGDTIKISGCTVAFKLGSLYAYMTGYNSGKTNVYSDSSRTSNNYWTFDTMTSTEAQITVLDSNIAYFRFACADSTFYNAALTSNSSPAVDTSAIVINIKRNGEWL